MPTTLTFQDGEVISIASINEKLNNHKRGPGEPYPYILVSDEFLPPYRKYDHVWEGKYTIPDDNTTR